MTRHLPSALAAAVVGLAAIVGLPGAAPGWLAHTLEARVPVPPAIATVDGRPYLVHELHLTNLRREAVEVRRVTVRGDEDAALVDLSGTALLDALLLAGAGRASAAPAVLAPGQRAVVYVWAAMAAVPRRVRHDVEVAAPTARPPVEGVVTTSAIATTADPVPAFGPPLAGGPWVAVYDPLLLGGHRTTLIGIDGVARIPARFAIDFIRAPANDAPAAPDTPPLRNGFGSDVLAVADGRIVAVRDGRPDLPAGVSVTPQPLPLDDGSGNFVVLDTGGGRFAVYEHLQAGSVRVAAGAAVRRGDPIAKLGSSGSTSMGPHLHFHVADAGSTLVAEGVPWATDFTVLGRYASLDALVRGAAWTPQAGAAPIRRQLPPAVSVVRF